MKELSLYEIKYKLKKTRLNKWEVYTCNIISYGLDFIQEFFNNRFGNNRFEILDSNKLFNIHIIDPEVIDDILLQNANAFENLVTEKERERFLNKHKLENAIKIKEKDFYHFDQIVNNGNEAKKDNYVWKYTDYQQL